MNMDMENDVSLIDKCAMENVAVQDQTAKSMAASD